MISRKFVVAAICLILLISSISCEPVWKLEVKNLTSEPIDVYYMYIIPRDSEPPTKKELGTIEPNQSKFLNDYMPGLRTGIEAYNEGNELIYSVNLSRSYWQNKDNTELYREEYVLEIK